MTSKNQGSHQADALGGRSKESQRRPIPDDVAIRADSDLTSHLREREKANDATGSSVARIPELTRHQNKKDAPPRPAPGSQTTRVAGAGRGATDSDGVASTPNAGNFRNKPEKNAHGGSFDLGGQGRAYPSRTSVVPEAVERDVKRLQETRNRQLGSNGKRAN